MGVGGLSRAPEGGRRVDHRLRLGPDPRPLLQEVAGADPEVVVVGEGAWWVYDDRGEMGKRLTSGQKFKRVSIR